VGSTGWVIKLVGCTGTIRGSRWVRFFGDLGVVRYVSKLLICLLIVILIVIKNVGQAVHGEEWYSGCNGVGIFGWGR
jgi:hypothetical protein